MHGLGTTSTPVFFRGVERADRRAADALRSCHRTAHAALPRSRPHTRRNSCMHRSLTLRRTAFTACVALLSFAGGTASVPPPRPRADTPGARQAAPDYRVAQGLNLCLRARCPLGTGRPGAEFSQVPGDDLRLFATCDAGKWADGQLPAFRDRSGRGMDVWPRAQSVPVQRSTDDNRQVHFRNTARVDRSACGRRPAWTALATLVQPSRRRRTSCTTPVKTAAAGRRSRDCRRPQPMRAPSARAAVRTRRCGAAPRSFSPDAGHDGHCRGRPSCCRPCEGSSCERRASEPARRKSPPVDAA